MLMTDQVELPFNIALYKFRDPILMLNKAEYDPYRGRGTPRS